MAELVEAAKSDDRHAFDELVRRTHSDMYTLALRLTGNDDDARDVVQDAYLRAFRAIKRFRGDAQFTTWMYRITANCANTHLSQRTRLSHDDLDDDAMVDERPQANPEHVAESGDLRAQVQIALAQLPPKLRSVIVLRDIYDLPHEDIAAELDISVTAAKVRLHRARHKLRAILYPDPSPSAEAGDDGPPGDGTEAGSHAV